MVDNLTQVFERATERYLDQISSSDEEIAVEYPEKDADGKVSVKRKRQQSPGNSTKRKPTLVAQIDKKKDQTQSDESGSQDITTQEPERIRTKKDEVPKNKKPLKNLKTIEKVVKKDKKDNKKKIQKNVKSKKKRSPSPSPTRSISRNRSLDRWSNSPPPSLPPSSPDDNDFLFASKPKHDDKKTTYQSEEGPEKSLKSNNYNFFFVPY